MAGWKYTLVVHTDLDGVAAAAIYLRLAGASLGSTARLFFAEPYNLPRVLRGISGDTERLVIADLGVNSGTFRDVVKALRRHASGAVVEWYDHHHWLDEWVSTVRSSGVKLYVDKSTCGAGVVAKYAPGELGAEPDEFIWELVRATCAADLWRWDHYMAPRLFRVVDRYKGRRGDAWRRELVRGFSEGALWWPALDEALEEYVKLEFEGYEYALRNSVVVEAGGCRFVATLKKPGPPSPSIIGNALMARFDADFAVIVRTRGRGLSFRSRSVDVQSLAVALGGGGHTRAAGAPLRMNILLRLLSYIYPRVKLRAAVKNVVRALASSGCRRIEESGDTDTYY